MSFLVEQPQGSASIHCAHYSRLVQNIRSQDGVPTSSGLAKDWDFNIEDRDAEFRDDLREASGIGRRRKKASMPFGGLLVIFSPYLSYPHNLDRKVAKPAPHSPNKSVHSSGMATKRMLITTYAKLSVLCRKSFALNPVPPLRGPSSRSVMKT